MKQTLLRTLWVLFNKQTDNCQLCFLPWYRARIGNGRSGCCLISAVEAVGRTASRPSISTGGESWRSLREETQPAGNSEFDADWCSLAHAADDTPPRGAGTRGDGVPHFFDRRDASPTTPPPLFGLKFVQKLVHCCNWLLAETQCEIISVQQRSATDTQTRVAVSQDKTKDPLWQFFWRVWVYVYVGLNCLKIFV